MATVERITIMKLINGINLIKQLNNGETTIIQKIKALGIGALIFGMTAIPVLAADYTKMSNEELDGLRGTMQQETQEVRAAFQHEWQERVRQCLLRSSSTWVVAIDLAHRMALEVSIRKAIVVSEQVLEWALVVAEAAA